MSAPQTDVRGSIEGVQRRALLVAVAAGVPALVGAVFQTDQFLRSWLLAFLFWMTFPMGSLGLSMLHHLTGGSWGLTIRRLLEAAMRTLPWMALLFVPIALGVGRLYPWADADVVAADAVLQKKEAYLNVPFWLVRAVVFFGVWIGVSRIVARTVTQQDRTGDPKLAHRLRMLAGPALGVYALTMTFASVDWGMSLEPHWFSTIYGVLFIVGQGLGTLCLSVVMGSWMARREPFSRWIQPKHFHDLGNLMLAFVLLWAYVSFSQYLIIWSGNLAEETPWYIHRTGHGWQAIAIVLIVFHFAVPFLVLLSRRTKRGARNLAVVAVALLFLRFVDVFWLIAPAFHTEGLHVSWLDVVVPVAVGGFWVAIFFRGLKGRPLISLQDAQLQGALEDTATRPLPEVGSSHG